MVERVCWRVVPFAPLFFPLKRPHIFVPTPPPPGKLGGPNSLSTRGGGNFRGAQLNRQCRGGGNFPYNANAWHRGLNFTSTEGEPNLQGPNSTSTGGRLNFLWGPNFLWGGLSTMFPRKHSAEKILTSFNPYYAFAWNMMGSMDTTLQIYKINAEVYVNWQKASLEVQMASKEGIARIEKLLQVQKNCLHTKRCERA